MCLSDKSHGPLQLLEVAPLASRTFSGFRATSSSRAVGALVVARERWLLVLLEFQTIPRYFAPETVETVRHLI